jgi:hypothetical protein
MENLMSWTPTHEVIATGLDYVSPGSEQAARVVKALRDKSLLNDQFTDQMQTEMSAKIDRYMQLIATGYAGSSLESAIIGLLTNWSVLGATSDAQEATSV